MRPVPAAPESPERSSHGEEAEVLADALVALRRASVCKTLSGSAAAALDATASLLEMYVDHPVLRLAER